MQYDRLIERALRDAQSILRANLPPAKNLPDDQAVQSLRAIVRSPQVLEVLERGHDTALCFVLRAVNRILSDHGQPDRMTINRLWDVLDETHGADHQRWPNASFAELGIFSLQVAHVTLAIPLRPSRLRRRLRSRRRIQPSISLNVLRRLKAAALQTSLLTHCSSRFACAIAPAYVPLRY
jgi:hypothetical protein